VRLTGLAHLGILTNPALEGIAVQPGITRCEFKTAWLALSGAASRRVRTSVWSRAARSIPRSAYRLPSLYARRPLLALLCAFEPVHLPLPRSSRAGTFLRSLWRRQRPDARTLIWPSGGSPVRARKAYCHSERDNDPHRTWGDSPS